MKQLKESSVKFDIPYYEEISLDMSDCEDSSQIQKLATYLEKELKSYFKEDNVTIKADVDGTDIYLVFEGEITYVVTPGTPASWDYPGDPPEFDGPEEDYTLDAVKAIVKKYPDYKVKNLPERIDGGIPSYEDISDEIASQEQADYEAYADRKYDQWKDSQFESVMNSVLAGKSLTEALNERAGDWDIESDEVYPEDAKDTFEREFEQWKKDVYIANKSMLAGVDNLQALLRSNPYKIDFDKVNKSDNKSYLELFKMMLNWGFNLNSFLDTINPYDGKEDFVSIKSR